MWGAAPSEPIETIFGTLSHLMDVINCGKFNLDRPRGVWARGTSEKCMLPFESEVVLNTVQHCLVMENFRKFSNVKISGVPLLNIIVIKMFVPVEANVGGRCKNAI